MSLVLWSVVCWLFGVICFGVLPWMLAPVLPGRARQKIGGWYCGMAAKILHRFSLVFRDSHEIELHSITFDQAKRAEKVTLDGETEHISDDLNAMGRLFGHRFGVAHEPSALFTSPLRADFGEAVRRFRTTNSHRRFRRTGGDGTAGATTRPQPQSSEPAAAAERGHTAATDTDDDSLGNPLEWSDDDIGNPDVVTDGGSDLPAAGGGVPVPAREQRPVHDTEAVEVEYAAAVPFSEAPRLVRLRHFERIVCGNVDAHEAERAKEFGLKSQQGFGDRVSTKQALIVGGAYMASGLMTWFAMKYGRDVGGGVGDTTINPFGLVGPAVDVLTAGVLV